MPSHPSICAIKMFKKIMSDDDGQPMSIPNDSSTILVSMTVRWWNIASIDQLSFFILLDQLKNLMQSTPMRCFVDHKFSHYVSIVR